MQRGKEEKGRREELGGEGLREKREGEEGNAAETRREEQPKKNGAGKKQKKKRKKDLTSLRAHITGIHPIHSSPTPVP